MVRRHRIGMTGPAAAMPQLPDNDTFWTLLLSLRAQGYDLDTGQMAAAVALLARAQAAPDGDAARTRFWSRLIPVLATSVDTARSLRRQIDAWMAEGTADPIPAAPPAAPAVPARRAGLSVGRTLIMVGSVLGVLLGFIAMQSPVRPLPLDAPAPPPGAASVPPTQPQADTPQPDLHYGLRTIQVPAPPPAGLPYIQAGLMAAPPLGFAAWVLVCWHRRRVRLRACSGIASTKTGASSVLPGLDVMGSPLFTTPAVRHAAHALRAHRYLPSGRWDVPRTVAATARRAGALQPIRALRRATPEHLVLIERKARGDHLAALFQLAIRRLQAEGLAVRIYHYSRDPRLLVFQPWQGGPAEMVEIEQLRGDATQQRLIIIGPALGLLDPGRGDVAPWLEEFRCWTDRALLDPVARAYRIGAEKKLMAAGWFLGVAQEAGLGRLGDWLAPDEVHGA